MSEIKVPFCTCKSTDCPLHPTNQDEGCTPCIAKNLKGREVPSCFFNAVGLEKHTDGWHFEDFAEMINDLKKKKIKDAITQRHSVRKYQDKPIEEALVKRLNEIIDDCNVQGGLNIQLMIDDPACFQTFLARYGKFSGVKNYVALIGRKDIKNLDERCGYYGQRIVLEAQAMGLNTCWVAGTYRKGKCNAKIEKDEKLVCVIAIGYGEEEGAEHKCKPMSKLCDIPEDEMPDWFKEGMDAAMKAPTAMNQQKFVVSIKKGEPVIRTRVAPLADIDLGIVKYNFETASGRRCK